MRTYKVELELSIDIPDQYEFSRLLNNDDVGDFDYPPLEAGESMFETFSFRGRRYCVVVRRAWQWPQWLTANYIAMDEDGRWHAYLAEPSIRESNWIAGVTYHELGGSFTTFLPPPCDDWKKSLRKNPNHK